MMERIVANRLLPAFAAVALIGLLGACATTKPCPCACPRANAKAVGGSRAAVQLYSMSQCPHGIQATRGLTGALRALGDRVDLRLDYIVDEPKDGAFKALHGPAEVAGNIVQLCVLSRHPTAKALAFIGCQSRSPRDIPYNWKSCARDEGIELAPVETCLNGPEGKKLLRASMKRAQAAKATGSPTILIAGKPYEGGRDANDFLRAICPTLGKDAPVACRQLPQPVAVTVVVLSDKRCKEESCDTKEYEEGLQARYLPKLTVKRLDFASAEGRALFDKTKLKKLPALLFGDEVEKAEKYPFLARFMMPAGGYRQLMVPAKWDPKAEICDNKVDDTGNGKVDCDDPTCAGKILCRKEQKRTVAAFVMSQCPFGAQALLAMKEVLANFKGKVTFDVHYIASRAKNGKFESLHGAPEVAENIRQLCAKKHYRKGNRYLDYVWCRSADYESADWQKCAKGRIKAKVIDACATGKEGVELLAADIKLAEALGFEASPTWLANNRHKFHGVSPEAIKTGICAVNKGLAGCEKTLRKTAGTPAGACGAK